MTFEDFFNMNSYPEDLVWVVQDNTTNERDVFKYIDSCPVGLENLRVNNYYIFDDEGVTCIYVSCVRG